MVDPYGGQFDSLLPQVAHLSSGAAQRWSERTLWHRRVRRAVAARKLEELDSKQRREDRREQVAGTLPPLLANFARSRQISLQRVIGLTRDFFFMQFFEKGIFVSHAVCRISNSIGASEFPIGSGFLVSPNLLLTNQHVLPTAEACQACHVEFGHQHDRFGNLSKGVRHRLDPRRFLLISEELDFTLVALESAQSLDRWSLPWCPMIKKTGKVVVGEPVNIIQHPLGREKQVVFRNNLLMDIFEDKDVIVHYQADTDRGSSGSPVFNDQWQVVALHRAGIPKINKKGQWLRKDGRIWRKDGRYEDVAWVANEGIRTSKIVAEVEQAKVVGDAIVLKEEFLEAKAPQVPDSPWIDAIERFRSCFLGSSTDKSIADQSRPSDGSPGSSHPDPSDGAPQGPGRTLVVPVNVSIAVHLGKAISSDGRLIPDQTEGDEEGEQPESVVAARYADRMGYHSQFLGVDIPFPELTDAIRPDAFAFAGRPPESSHLVNYHHFSLLFHRGRKLAFVAGVNYDPNAPYQQARSQGREEWRYDQRVAPVRQLQVGESLFGGNPLDKGHLVRRADAAWGQTMEEARLAGDDTFHYTNCSPQHEITNRGLVQQAPPGLVLWGRLEDFLADEGKKSKRKLCIFNGPIFRPSDRRYRDVQLPKEFWKIVAFLGSSGEPRAVGFRLTQEPLIQGLEENLPLQAYETVQVSIESLERATLLDMAPLVRLDVLRKRSSNEHLEGLSEAIRIRELGDIIQ